MEKKKLPETIDLKSNFNITSILMDIMDKLSFKRLLRLLFAKYMFDGVSYLHSTLGLLADKNDVDRVEAMVITKYVIDNYDKVLKDTGKHWGLNCS